MGREPGLFIAGVQKCGTSALYDSLCQHSKIAGPRYLLPESSPYAPKELHFFNDLKRFQLGWQWYFQHFDDDVSLKVEATPEYVIHRRAIKAIAERLPEARIIVVLRNPLDRALSGWNHWQSLPPSQKWPVLKPGGTLIDNIQAEMELLLSGKMNGKGFFGRGLYFLAAGLLRKHYPEHHLKVVFLDDLAARPDEELESLQKWLGLPIEPLEFRHIHARKRQRLLPDLRVLKDLWDTYQIADRALETSLQRPVSWTTQWNQWLADNEHYLFEEEQARSESFHGTCERMRQWLAEHSHEMMLQSRWRKASQDQALFNDSMHASEPGPQTLEGLRIMMCHGSRPSHEQIRAAWAVLGGERRALLTLLVEFGEEDLAAELYRSGIDSESPDSSG